MPEFVNPKYTDGTKTAFKSPTRLECMMQVGCCWESTGCGGRSVITTSCALSFTPGVAPHHRTIRSPSVARLLLVSPVSPAPSPSAQ